MKICLWGNVARALEGKTGGGAELQIALLARALAMKGNEVVVVDIFTEKDYVTANGINVVAVKGYDKGVRVLRFLTSRMPRLYDTLVAQQADIYYSQIRDFRHLMAFRAARKVNGKFVIQLASDLDAKGLMMKLKYDYLTHFEGLYWFFKVSLNELIFPWLIRNADLVLVQHEGQKRDLEKKGISSVIFNNLFEVNEIPAIANPEREVFCYVGSLDNRKGFTQFYDLAQKAPFASFKVIGQPRDKTGNKYYEKIKTLKNVILSGRLNHADTLYQIANSKAMVSTSPMEGFPNIFIEAWACGIPVLSLSFDPGGIIRKYQLGEVADGNIDRLVELIRAVKSNSGFSDHAKEYVERNHKLNENKLNEINRLFSSLYKKKD